MLSADLPRNAGAGGGTVAVQGVCFDANASFARGAAGGPVAIRQALFSGSANLCAENGFDLAAGGGVRFVEDDLRPAGADVMPAKVEGRVAELLARGVRVLCLGGDHSITHPILRAYAGRYPRISVLHLDAHPDLYDELDGNRFSHACPFARIMEEKLADRLVQVGIRTSNGHQREQARRFGVEVVPMADWHDRLFLRFQGPLYLSIDLDVLDPAFAPGVSHHEPGGASTRQLIGLLQRLEADVVGADIVECNPLRDVGGMTAMTGAKLVKEVAALMAAADDQRASRKYQSISAGPANT